jgi:hypothetical protein
MPLRKIDERVKAKKTLEDSLKLLKKKEKDMKNLPKGLRKDTTTSAYGDAGRGRSVPEFSHGGEAKVRGMGCAIKGGKFEGVF